jgi:diacylglycerol kinase family enzyme
VSSSPAPTGPEIALLANPESGAGDGGDAERLLRDSGAAVRRFDLADLDAAVASGPERIVVAGGDGSLGPAAAAAAAAGVPLAVLAVGTANDFARSLGLPDEPERAARLAVEGRRTRSLDLGWMSDRPFVNVASAGLSPVAARKAHGLKGALGPLAYAVGALRAGFTAQPVSCRVGCDGSGVFAGRAWQVSVAVTGAFGAGSELEADPRDGLLDVVVIEAGSRARLPLRAYGLRAGSLERQSGTVCASGREILVETDGEAGFNVDGELVSGTCFRFTVEPRAFELVVA